jgi:hypothetical protein
MVDRSAEFSGPHISQPEVAYFFEYLFTPMPLEADESKHYDAVIGNVWQARTRWMDGAENK